jgi:hypothetical protein
LVLSTLSFAAGVAGDLSLADGPTSGTRVVLRIPPELPLDAVRAAPLPIVSTPTADARPVLSVAHFEPVEPLFDPLEGAAFETLITVIPKQNPDLTPKHEGVHAA